MTAVQSARWTSQVRRHLLESADLQRALSAAVLETVVEAAAVITHAINSGGKVMACGNGGSAADAQHFAGELVGRFEPGLKRPALPAMALTTDTSILTALGNDFGFLNVFQRQVEALGRPGDVLLAISTSGNSANVLQAVEAAKARGIRTIGLTGRSGKLIDAVDLAIAVPSDSTPRIQESHITLVHIICNLVEHMYLDSSGAVG